jgi:hypothetical protein
MTVDGSGFGGRPRLAMLGRVAPDIAQIPSNSCDVASGTNDRVRAACGTPEIRLQRDCNGFPNTTYHDGTGESCQIGNTNKNGLSPTPGNRPEQLKSNREACVLPLNYSRAQIGRASLSARQRIRQLSSLCQSSQTFAADARSRPARVKQKSQRAWGVEVAGDRSATARREAAQRRRRARR